MNDPRIRTSELITLLAFHSPLHAGLFSNVTAKYLTITKQNNNNKTKNILSVFIPCSDIWALCGSHQQRSPVNC